MTIKISQLGNLTTVYGNTIVPVVANVAGTLTTVKGNIDQLGTYITSGVSADVALLQTNAATQSDLINGINANVTQANLGMTGYVNNAVTTANVGIIGYINQGNTIQAAAIASANVGIIGYIDRGNTIVTAGITTANVGMKGYVDQGNSIQSAQLTAANIGMIGYVGQQVTTANVGMKGYVDSQSYYSNVKVSQYLPTYTGNIGGPLNIIGAASVYGVLNVGYTSPITFGNVVVNAVNTANSYVQLNIQNISTVGAAVSADFIATAPDGTDSSKYIDMGINGNNFSSSAWTISGADDGYLYVNSGNLTLGTDTPVTTVKVHVGGTLAANVVTTFAANGVTIGGNLTVSNVYVPTANNSVGTKGQITYDGSYVYVCIAANTWRRANLAVW